MMDDIERSVESLTVLGFSDLEARLYLHFAANGADTAYAAAKAVGKAVANSYKAVESLERKGAVEATDGEPRMVRATPPGELMKRLRAGFERSAVAAEAELARIEPGGVDERVYQLRSAELVLERSRELIANAERAVAVDLFPEVAAELGPELIAAAERGVSVAALVYEPIDLPGCTRVVHTEGGTVTRLIEAQHLLVSADAERVVLGLVDAPEHVRGVGVRWAREGGVRQAIFTASPFIAWHLHDNFHHQLFTYAVRETLADEREVLDRLRSVYEERLAGIAPISTPGWETLLRRHGSEDALELTRRILARRTRDGGPS